MKNAVSVIKGGMMREGASVLKVEGWSMPVMVALGFASFKTAQGSLYSTAMLSSDSSMIMVSNLEFSVISAVFVMVAALVIIGLMATGKLSEFSLPVGFSSIVLAVTAVVSQVGLLDASGHIGVGMTAFVQGVLTVVLTLAWVEMFARLATGEAMKSLATAMLVAALLACVVQLLPSWVTLPFVVVLLLLNIVLYYHARRRTLAAASPKLARALPARSVLKEHARGLFSIGEGLLSLLAFGCTIGIINGFMFSSGAVFEGSAKAMPTGTLVAAIAFFIVAYSFPKTYSVTRAYRVMFPVITALLILWPFAQFAYTYYFSLAFVVGHAFISTSVMYLIIHVARERSLSAGLFMAVSIVLIRLSSVAGLLAGSLVAGLDFDPLFKTMLVIVIVVYLLSLTLLFMARARKGGTLDFPRTQNSAESLVVNDGFERVAEQLGKTHRFTERERDIVVHLARGRTANHIGQTLYLSPNTVRGYIKSIYAKLEVHSKQEVIDLFSKRVAEDPSLRT